MKHWFNKLHFHIWKYFSGGSRDVGTGYGLRYRQCTVCLKIQRFNDFTVEYEDA